MSVTKDAISSFYDIHSSRMLRNYVNGNIRISAAIDLLIATLAGRKGKLLDIGCGIGISGNAVTAALPDFEVVGVDISPRSIEIADRLFGNQRASFSVSDMSETPPGGPFDAVAMLDVYEHFPRNDWPKLNAVLGECLASDGVLILTTPTPLHQQYLAEHNPAGLQIIDETVELDDIANLAKAIGGTLTHYSFQHCWRTNQYLHVVIERAPKYNKPYLSKTTKAGLPKRAIRRASRLLATGTHKLATFKRRGQVKKRLGVTVK